MHVRQEQAGLAGFSWLLLALLCGLGATRWLLPEASGVTALGLPLAVPAGVFLAASLAWSVAGGARQHRPVAGDLGRAGAGGALLFAGLALPRWQGGAVITGAAWTMAFALTPVVLAVAEPALGPELPESLAGRMWPGLAGIAGLLLLLPEPSIRSVGEGLALAAAPLLAGVGAALLRSAKAPVAWVRAVGLAGALAVALVGGAAALVQAKGSWRWPAWSEVGFEGAMVLLSFAVLLRVGVFRWSAAFLLVPLLIAVEGVVLMRPELSGRPLLGMGLLLLGTTYLLLPGGAPSAEG